MYQFVNNPYPHKENSVLTQGIGGRNNLLIRQFFDGTLQLYENVDGKLYLRLIWKNYLRDGYSRSDAAELMLRNYPLEKSAYTFMKG